MAELPRWAGRASLPSLCPFKLAARCPSQLPRKGNECLAPPGFAPLEQMVQHPWGLGREEDTKLVMGGFIFRHQRSDAHFSSYNYRRLPRFPGPCLVGRSRSWRAKSKGLGCIARTGRIWGRMAEKSPGLPYGPQEGTEGSIPFCLVWSDPPLLQLVSFLALKK